MSGLLYQVRPIFRVLLYAVHRDEVVRDQQVYKRDPCRNDCHGLYAPFLTNSGQVTDDWVSGDAQHIRTSDYEVDKVAEGEWGVVQGASTKDDKKTSVKYTGVLYL